MFSRARADRRPMTIGALVLFATLLPAVASASAHDPDTCLGREVTIYGTAGPDEIQGTDGDDVIQASGGRDIIYAGAGNDVVCAGGGKDIVYGEAGDDIIHGGRKNDTLIGGDGNDILIGKEGDDRLWGNEGTDNAKGAIGSDVCRAESEHRCELDRRRGYDPEDWRTEVETYFGPLATEIDAPNLVEEAMTVMACESSGEPFAENPRSTASGLFQFLDGTWDRWNPRTAGWEGESVYHPEANVATAASLVRATVVQDGKPRWIHWSPCDPTS